MIKKLYIETGSTQLFHCNTPNPSERDVGIMRVGEKVGVEMGELGGGSVAAVKVMCVHGRKVIWHMCYSTYAEASDLHT